MSVRASSAPTRPIRRSSTFTYIVNVDNAKDPFDPVPTNRPGFGGTESNSPVVATGDDGDAAEDARRPAAT